MTPGVPGDPGYPALLLRGNRGFLEAAAPETSGICVHVVVPIAITAALLVRYEQGPYLTLSTPDAPESLADRYPQPEAKPSAP